MAKLGNVTVEIIGKDKASPAMRKAKKSTDDLNRASKGLGGTFGKLGAAAKRAMPMLTGAAVIAGLTKMITLTAQAGDKFAKMSQKLGISVETLSSWEHVAKLSGTTIEAVALGMKRFSVNVVDMSRNMGEAKREFEALNISVKDSEGKLRSTEDLLLDIADKFARMEDGTMKTNIAMRLLGRSGAEMIPMLNKGRAGIQGMIDEAKRMNKVFTEETAKAMEDFNDNMERLRGGLTGLAFAVGKEVVPALSDMIDMILRIGGIERAFDQVRGMTNLIIEWENKVKDLTQALGQAESAYWKNENKIRDLKEQLGFAKQTVIDYTKSLDLMITGEKTLGTEAEKAKELAKARKKAADELANATKNLQQEYNKMFLSEREMLELWQLERLAIKGIDEEMVNAIYQRNLVAIATEEIVERNKEAAESYKELAGSIGEVGVARSGMLEVGAPMAEYMEQNIEDMERFKGEVGGVEEAANRLGDSISSGLGEAVAGMIVQGRKFGEIMKGIFRMLVAEVVKYIVKLLIAKAIKTVISPATAWIHEGGMIAHGGGMVMHGGGMVPWIKAHRGLLPDERPTILQTGEGVLSRRGVAAIGGPGVVEAANQGTSIGTIMMTNNMGGINNIVDAEEMGVMIGENIISTIRESA